MARAAFRTSLRLLALLLLAAPFVLAVACGGGSGGGGAASTEKIVAGQKVFLATCATCHGKDAKGLPKLGKNLHANNFVSSNSDEDMIAFVKHGRPTSDPLNTSGVDMPPKGGNPALTDQDIDNVIAYVRTLE